MKLNDEQNKNFFSGVVLAYLVLLLHILLMVGLGITVVVIKGIYDRVDHAYTEGFEDGYKAGAKEGERKANDNTTPVAEVVHIIACSISEYALEASQENALTVEQFIAVAEVAVALDEVAKQLK
jgi:hypothetical protein